MNGDEWINGGALFGGVSEHGLERLVDEANFLARVVATVAVEHGLLPSPSLAGRYLDARDMVQGVYLTYREARG